MPGRRSRARSGEGSPASGRRVSPARARSALRGRGLEVAMQHRADLVLDLRTALDQPAAARHEPAQHPGALVTDPDPRDQIRGEQVGEHLGVDLVGLHPRVADRPDLLGVREHDLGGMRPEDPRDRKRAAGRLHHDAVCRRRALRERLKLLGRRRDLAHRARPPAASDRDLTEVAMHIQPDRPAHHTPPVSMTTQLGERWTKRHPVPERADPTTQAGRSQRAPAHSHAGTPRYGT